MPLSGWLYHIYPVIPRPDGTEALAQSNGGALLLPCLRMADSVASFTSEVNAWTRATLGIDVTVLRCISIRPDIEHRCSDVLLAMENHSATTKPPHGATWIGPDSLDQIAVSGDQRAAIRAFLERDAGAPDLTGAPWERRGWLDRAITWIAGQLGSTVTSLAASLVQLAASPAYSMLSVETRAGKFFFKALGQSLAREYWLTVTLSNDYPCNSPVIVASSDPDLWLLMEDAGGRSLDQVPDTSCWENALRNFSQIQVDFVRKANLLTDWGCSHWGLDMLPDAIDEFFSFFWAVENRVSVEFDEGNLGSLAERLKSICTRLQCFGIPSTLGHGDLNPGNVLAKEDRFIYLDWAEGYFGHPFFSFADFAAGAKSNNRGLTKLRERLGKAYLEPWSRHLSGPRLEEALRLSEPLAILRYATAAVRNRPEPEELTQDSAVLLASFLQRLVDRMRVQVSLV